MTWTLRRRIFALRETGQTSLADLADLGRDITLAYAAAVSDLLNQQSLSPSRIAAVAAHGQTLYHAPPLSIQWLDPALLARETGCAVVSDFRRADLAAGGQGAPLVPFADWILFRHPTKNRVILNLGGIANLTWLPAGGGIDDVIAFDTGPGCCVLDHLMRRHDPTGPGFDRDGRLAASGHPDAQWAARVLAQDLYFDRPPPKSTDVPEMLAACRAVPEMPPRLADALATACLLTAASIHRALDFLPNRPGEVIVAGGGARNPALMATIREQVALLPTEPMALPASAREAVAFALLGAATLDGEPSNVPAATGARSRVVLGSLTPRPTPGKA